MYLYRKGIKRAMDVIISLFGLILSAPLLFLLALIIRVKIGSPVFFRQQRPGLNGTPFNLIKFRSMTEERGPDGKLLPDSQRLHAFGKFLRNSSLDELPELINILKGEMSLVGPRPLLMQYLPLYSTTQGRRHEVRPGLTGWAQVNGRNALNWEKRFECDVWYVDNQSFLVDIKILAKTVQSVLSGSDVSAEGHVTMPVFTGGEPAGTGKDKKIED